GECAAFVCSAAQHMQQLISDLLAYTRAGHVDRAVETPADMNAVLQLVLSMLRGPIEAHRCTVKAHSLPRVRVHEMHVQQILQNLISNAIKYRSDERDPQIEIWAEPKGELWQIAVRDNGIGIEPQYAEQI